MIIEKLKRLLLPGESLQEKTIKSLFWSFVSRASTRGLDLLRTLIVARLLSPKDFGLLGIALLTIAIFEVFSKTGFKESIIQNKEKVDEHLNTAWTLLSLRGIALYGIVFLSAPFIANFFNEPRALLVIRVIGLTLVFRGLQNIGVIFFRKELDFRKKFVLDLSRALPAFILSVSLAFAWRNVWALVYGNVFGAGCLLVTSFLIHGHRPEPELKLDKAKEMFGFGKWILASSIIIFFLTQGDDIFVGRFLGAAALGVYILAYRISNLVATEVSHTIIRVLFPSFSKLQDDLNALKKAYKKVLRLSTFVIFPTAGLIFALINNFTFTVLTSKWAPIIPLVMLFVFQAANRAIRGPIGSLLKGIGRPDLESKVSAVQLIILIILIYPASLKYGILGVTGVVVFQSLVSTPILLRYSLPEINMKLKEWINSISLSFIGSVITVVIIYNLQIMLSNGWLTLILEGVAGISVYLTFIYVCIKLNILEAEKVLKDLKGILHNLKGG